MIAPHRKMKNVFANPPVRKTFYHRSTVAHLFTFIEWRQGIKLRIARMKVIACSHKWFPVWPIFILSVQCWIQSGRFRKQWTLSVKKITRWVNMKENWWRASNEHLKCHCGTMAQFKYTKARRQERWWCWFQWAVTLNVTAEKGNTFFLGSQLEKVIASRKTGRFVVIHRKGTA